MRVAGYTRVSTAEQATEGISLEAQAAKIRQYAELNDMQLVEIVEDAGYSAKTASNRPGVQAIMEMVRTKAVDAVIIYKLDRLARNTIEALDMAQKMDRAGVALHSITEKLDTQSALGRFFFTLTASLAAMEREMISERTKMALTVKRDKGQRISGKAPYGFDFDGNGNLVENETEQNTIRTIKELKALGHTIRGIVAYLAEHNITNRAGNGFGTGEIWKLTKKAA